MPKDSKKIARYVRYEDGDCWSVIEYKNVYVRSRRIHRGEMIVDTDDDFVLFH